MKRGNFRLQTLLAVVVIFFTVFNTAASVNPSGTLSINSPQKVVQTLVEKIRSIKRPEDDNSNLSPKDIKYNNKLYGEISSLIDIMGISRYALDDDWNRVGASGQKKFQNLFRQLLEKVAYPNTAKFFKDLELEIRNVKVIKSKAMVYTSVYHEEEGRVDIDFKLQKNDHSWVIVDVYLDGVSLVRNLRTQCQKIIREHSFAELLKRMEKKLSEEDKADISEITAR
ncbi:MAG TPA: ABC transporter substrate-binding protein [Thermodesulforhabdus norvegica]|uniref:ABC transporter substrate-binding protein n=1 Tax=Thermodesulforhabdus norvegica TaxID=39841 RepID=A0A7C0WV82_9BACT|nr:ABC transporter substrate-binding protein [Thermodesulforhabdus norvegica]